MAAFSFLYIAFISVGLVFFATLYCIHIVWFFVGLGKLKRGSNRKTHSFSVIIPARDEEKNIGACLDSVSANDYPADKLEIIVVDDGSTDGTSEVVERIRRKDNRLKLVRVDEVPEGISPKKYAVSMGASSATGEIIATTDADCIAPPKWISSLNREFEDNVGMVVGYTDFRRQPGLFTRIQSLDYFSHRALAAGTIGAGIPYTSTASNLAFRKDLFDSIGHYNGSGKWVSGDDDMLLMRIVEDGKYEIRACVNPDSFVVTSPAGSFSEFWSQRVRWASKGAAYKGGVKRFLTITVVFYISLIALLPWVITYTAYFKFYFYALLSKLIADFIFLRRATHIFNRRDLLILVLPMELLHIPYVILVSAWSYFGSFTWKGRKFKKTIAGSGT